MGFAFNTRTMVVLKTALILSTGILSFLDVKGKCYLVEGEKKMGPGILGSKKMRKKGDEASSFFVLAAFFFFACGPCPTSSFKTLGHFFQWKNILLSTYITDEKFRF